ncbi:MAG TPA: CBS domain-containing protein [Gemmataceae bacterium]|nr:CBS domain-containing protein [Gemmataceae bacterium]
MPATSQILTTLTAGEIMTRDVLQIPETMPLREAARLLLLHQISGAPVVEAGGTCVGVISTFDLLRWANQRDEGSPADGIPRPRTCFFQLAHREPSGEIKTLCMLSDGVCPIQRNERGADGIERTVCTEPHCVSTDWQVVEVEELPTEEVGQLMTCDPVLVSPDTPITDLARYMVDVHIHRLIVVDRQRRPLGVVSTTDILAQVARAGPDGSIPDASSTRWPGPSSNAARVAACG